jgi:hypothetical protein
MPWSPYLAPSLLKAYAHRHGFELEQHDLNLPFFEQLLSPAHLAETAKALERVIFELGAQGQLSPQELYRLRVAMKGMGDAEYAAQNVEEAKAIFRGQRFYDVKAYRWAMDVLELALSSESALWFPSELTTEGFRSRYSPFSANEILTFCEAPGENPYLPFYERILPALELGTCDFVGLSVAFTDQVLPALSLAKRIKELAPQVFICMGGNFYSRVGPGLEESPELFEHVDAIVVGEGELPLVRLLSARREGREDEDIPRVARRRNGRVRLVPAGRESVSARDLPVPDFNGLELRTYLSPEPVLPLLTFKGCSYGKCTFCDHHVNYAVVSGRPGHKVAEDVEALARKYACRSFTFVDEEMPPVHAEAVARALLEPGRPEVRWMGYAIYGKNWSRERWELLARSGCREMLFGFESASERVLELMKKPISLEQVERITRDMNEAGIASRINVIVGYPGETEEEAEATVRFFANRRELFDVPGTLIAFHPFLLVRNAPLAQSELGQGIVRVRQDQPLSLHYAYELEALPGAIPAERAFQLAKELSAKLSSLYTKSADPLGRVHRFLYSAERSLRPLAPVPDERQASPRAEAAGGDEELPTTVTRVNVIRFSLERLAEFNRETATTPGESYELWTNMLSRSAQLCSQLSAAAPSSVVAATRDSIYLHVHAIEPAGGLRSQLLSYDP